MKAPLTEKYFKENFGPKISKKSERLNLQSHVRGLDPLEKNLLKAPCDKQAAQLMNNCIKNVKTCSLAIKNVEGELKKEIVAVNKALKQYVKDHNAKIVGKISSGTIGSVPGGMKALEAQSDKEFTMESFNFMRDSQKVGRDGPKLMALHKKYLEDINISSRERKAYVKANKATAEAYAELKKKENKTDERKRKVCLEIYNDAVNDLYDATALCRKSIVKMMNDAILRMKQHITLVY